MKTKHRILTLISVPTQEFSFKNIECVSVLALQMWLSIRIDFTQHKFSFQITYCMNMFPLDYS